MPHPVGWPDVHHGTVGAPTTCGASGPRGDWDVTTCPDCLRIGAATEPAARARLELISAGESRTS